MSCFDWFELQRNLGQVIFKLKLVTVWPFLSSMDTSHTREPIYPFLKFVTI